VQVPVYWHRPEDVARASRGAFVLESIASLGVVLPPPGPIGRPLAGWAARLDRVDRIASRWPLLRRWGDHVMYVLRRR
jgi:hypothetical protein